MVEENNTPPLSLPLQVIDLVRGGLVGARGDGGITKN
jgi:hypothetical protein